MISLKAQLSLGDVEIEAAGNDIWVKIALRESPHDPRGDRASVDLTPHEARMISAALLEAAHTAAENQRRAERIRRERAAEEE